MPGKSPVGEMSFGETSCNGNCLVTPYVKPIGLGMRILATGAPIIGGKDARCVVEISWGRKNRLKFCIM